MDIWRLEKYKTLVGENVSLTELETENGCTVKIDSVEQSTSLGDEWESFTVVMTCDTEIEQGCFKLTHPEHGSTTIFVSPNSPTELESVFSYELEKLES